MGNALVQKKTGIATYLTNEAVRVNITNVVGKMNSERFISSVVSAVQTNPALSDCTNTSIFSAALLGESLKLSPSPQLGQYYMVPYENKKTKVKEAQFQMGYKGYIQLAIRSGQYKRLNVLAIKEGELIKYDPLLEEIEVKLIEDEEVRENAKTIGYYATFEYVNGFRKSLYWSKKKMITHADRYSQAFSKDAKEVTVRGEKKRKVSFEEYEAGKYPKGDDWMYSSFWYKDFDAMAYKTMLRQLISKWGIMSVEMERAYVKDMSVIDENGDPRYADNPNIIDEDEDEDEVTNPFEKEENNEKSEKTEGE